AARLVDRLLRLPAVGVLPAGRVAEPFREERQHPVEHAGIDRGGGVVVEVDRPGHSAAVLVSAKATGIGGSAGDSAAISCSEQSEGAATIRSLFFQRGSRTLHFAYWPQFSSWVEQAVTWSGPSMASMMSATEIRLVSRSSRYPPRVPWSERTSPCLASRCSTLASSSRGMSYDSAISRALAEAPSVRVARCFIAIRA